MDKLKQEALLGSLTLDLSIFQLATLCQAKHLQTRTGTVDAVQQAHSLAPTLAMKVGYERCNERDWKARAQALALERLGLLRPDRKKTRWLLTQKGEMALQLFMKEIWLDSDEPKT